MVKVRFIQGRKVCFTPPTYWKAGHFLWFIFGNSDDPYPPICCWPNKPLWFRRFLWLFVRNPLHNFFFYVVGFTHRDRFIKGASCDDLFRNGWNWQLGKLAKQQYFWIPFISYKKVFKKRIFEFYIGWRYAGNLGFACRWHRRKT